jgi:anti-sigma regulatory factor (Ser/Thr protein kinase)
VERDWSDSRSWLCSAEALGLTMPWSGRVPDLDASSGSADLGGEPLVLLDFAPTASACREARRAVQGLCRSPRLTPLANDAALLVSEVMSNAIRHATKRITLRVTCSKTTILVSVTDDGERSDVDLAPRQLDHSAETGRGLFVIDRIASEWGSSCNAQGTSVWFLLS